MSYAGLTPTKLGRTQAVPPLQLHRLHITAEPAALREVTWTIPVPVLDQEDLFKQGVDTSVLVPGAKRVDALRSCTCQSGVAHAAERWVAAGKDLAALKILGRGLAAADPKACEEAAIVLYHGVTDQTGDPAAEWPPVDCGSSGYYVCAVLEKQRIASTYKTASGVTGALSLLQSGSVMTGSPWFYAWETPGSDGFIDGDGSTDALQAAIASGVAGGHETLIYKIEQLAVTAAGVIDLARTVLRGRNSWSPGWNPALRGDYRVHASTLAALAQYTDFKSVVI